MLIGTLLALASAILWSAANVAIGPAARRLGAFGALVWAQIVGGLVLCAAAPLIDGPLGAIDARVALLLAGAGVAALLAYGGLFEALRLGKVAVVVPVLSSWSLVSVACGVAFLGERVGAAGAIGIAAVLAGNLAIAWRQRGGTTAAARDARRALLAAVASALGFGVMLPAASVAGAVVGRTWVVPCVWGIELAFGVPILIALGRLRGAPPPARDLGLALRPGVLEAVGFMALSFGAAHAPVAVVSAVSSLSTAFSVLFGVTMLRERVDRVTLLGALLASAGVVLVNL